jgi:flagellar protein FlaI
MDSLLRNSLRMRPDRLVVGEVRGPEASTLFNAMDTGHQGCLGTIHANNAREMIIKLQEKPLSVPQSMLPLVDLIIVLGRHFSKEKGIQRNITQIAEVTRMENKVLLGTVYDFDRTENSLRRTVIPSHIFEEMAERATMTKNDLKQEISIRQGILEWMVKQNIRKPMEVLEVIQAYYFDQEEVLSIVSKGLS